MKRYWRLQTEPLRSWQLSLLNSQARSNTTYRSVKRLLFYRSRFAVSDNVNYFQAFDYLSQASISLEKMSIKFRQPIPFSFLFSLLCWFFAYSLFLSEKLSAKAVLYDGRDGLNSNDISS